VLLSLERRIDLINPATGRSEPFVTLDEEPEGNRLNDGKVAPDGSFWVGSMAADRSRRRPSGAHYRVTADRRCERKFDNFKVSNGLAWSADGRTMFHSDSHGPWIRRWRHEPDTGRLDNGTVIARPNEAIGRPDGAASDVEGDYWSAGVSAGRLNRWSPDGELREWVAVPVAHPTMLCFAGDDLRTIYVTSIGRAGEPMGGALLKFRLGVTGVPVARFALRS
jgi:sugar lactone lactonase YvrE